MRQEVEALSARAGERLVPIAFIHRHPVHCDSSKTDDEFLRGVFIDQVSTVVGFEDVRAVDATEPRCGCPGMEQLLRDAAEGSRRATLRSEYGLAFSLIVNRARERRLYAVQKTWCPFCHRAAVGTAQARLVADPRPLPALERARLLWDLGREIRAKIRFEREAIVTGPPR
jgi:hypothetical protein